MVSKIKKIIILLFIFLSNSNLYSNQALKVLIIPFKDNSTGVNNEVYSKIIEETLKTDLSMIPSKITKNDFENIIIKKLKKDDESRQIINQYYKTDILNEYYVKSVDLSPEEIIKIDSILYKAGFKKFIPIMLNDFDKNLKNDEYEKIYKKAFLKRVDLIITGFYITDGSKIRITFKVIDVLTERSKIIFNKIGEGGYNTFDVVLDSTKEFIKKLNTEIKPYPKNMNNLLREKQGRIISGDEKERFIFFNIGVSYTGLGFSNIIKYNYDKMDLTDSRNNYSNSVNPTFNFEICSNYKNNYYGFTFGMLIPFVYFVPNMFMHSDTSIGFIFGYKKEFFFSWFIRVTYIGGEKYGSNNMQTMFFYLGIGLGFMFRYLPEKYPFFIEAGFTIVLPKVPLNNEGNSNGPSLWNITTGNVSDKNFIFPVIFKIGAGYFFTEEFGLYLRYSMAFMYISYEFEYHDDKDDKYITSYFGEDIAVSYEIEFGIVVKSVFK